jgi:RNA polymerase sigma factor (sigma-70 family)
MLSDGELLQRYVREGSEEAFATLVRRHLNLVYRSALRRVGGDAHSADDVVQKVFTDLARKAGSLSDRANLAGWLYTGTRFAAGEIVRAEKRRRAQEQEAQTMHELETHAEIPGERLDPVLDEVMDLLNERDRDAVLLHFFEGLPFHVVGETLSLSADAARMRVNRALDRLRSELSRRGIASTSVALSTVLSAQSGFSAPTALASTVVRHVLAHAAPASGTALALARLLRAAKSTGGLVTAGATAVVVTVVVALNYSGEKPPANTLALKAPSAPSVPTAMAANPGAESESIKVESIPAEPETASPSPELTGAGETAPGPTAFASLAAEEKTLLKQLWAIHEYYGETRGTAIAFIVSAGAARFSEFLTGRDSLRARGWLRVTPSGGAVLTARGLTFGQAHAAEIDAYPNLFRQPDGTLVTRPRSEFGDLSPAEKTMLKRLWNLEGAPQPVAGRRAGFVVPPGSPGFESFSAARDALVAKGWVMVNPQRGGVFLRPAGKAFCEAHQDEIAMLPLRGIAVKRE